MDLHTIERKAQNDAERRVARESGQVLEFLLVLSKRKKTVLLFTCGALILAIIVSLLIPNKYTAETIVLPPGQNSSASSALMNQLGGAGALASLSGSGLGLKNPGDMYVALFRSRIVEDALVTRFGLMSRYHRKTMTDTRGQFENHSSVALGQKDGLIRIEVTDADPRFAAELANAYVDEFRRLSANLALTEASQRRAFFLQQLREANESLVTAEESMKQTQQSTGVLQIDSQARTLIESAAQLRAQIAAKEVELQGMGAYATEDNAEYLLAKRQLDALKDQLAALGGTVKDPGSEIIMPKGNLSEAETAYLRRLRDVRYYETIEQLMAKEFEMAKLDEAREGAVIQVAETAVPPDKKSSPKRTFIVLIATALGFFLACFWILFEERYALYWRSPV